MLVLTQGNIYYFFGKIQPPTTWQGGHIEKVWFLSGGQLKEPTGSPGLATFDAQMNLSGSFWIGTVGWATFLPGAKMNCALDVFTSGIGDPCYVTGNAWSKNAGYIILGSGSIGGGHSGVYLNPNIGGLQGFGWSKTLGWVPIFTNVVIDDRDNTSPNPVVGGGNTPTPIGGGGIPINFIGRVAIIGNVAGSRVYSFTNAAGITVQDPGNAYVSINHAQFLNPIKTNIARLLRNLPDIQRTNPNNPLHVYYQKDKDICFTDSTTSTGCVAGSEMVIHSNLIPNIGAHKSIQTYIVEGHDIIIDTSFNDFASGSSDIGDTKMKALIALKDKNGKGGDIVITKKASQIYAYLIAEGTVFSGEKTSTGIIPYVKDANSVLSGPTHQLYINGMLVSKNTIGGASQGSGSHDNAKCPILTSQCNPNNAHTYDVGYFRQYAPGPDRIPAIPEYREEFRDRLQRASVILDYNPGILTNPPPGLENIPY